MEKKAKQSTREPINHYRKNYGIVPPWILFTDISFTTLVNFVKFLKRPERESLVHTLYGEEVDDNNLDSFKDFLNDTLFMCLDYRNKAAHGGRIYNFIPQNTLRTFNGAHPREGLPQLYFALEYLQYDTPFNRFTAGLTGATNFYCKSFHTKEDVSLLEATTGFKITEHNYVWLNHSSNIIHRKQYCGGAFNLQRIDLSDIQSQNYQRCKRCFRQNT